LDHAAVNDGALVLIIDIIFWNTAVEINPYLTLIKELKERTDVLRGYL
jgi:hypothetical protein